MNPEEVVGAEDNTGQKRERSPSFPYLDLKTAIDYARILYKQARTQEVRIFDIAEPWEMKPKSGSLLRYVAALGQYGLIESSGSGEQRKIKISGTGRRILEDDRPGVREELCAEAALLPPIMKTVYYGSGDFSGWGKERPSDNFAESALKFDLNFTPDAARRFLNVYDDTIKYIKDDEPEQDDKPGEEQKKSSPPAFDKMFSNLFGPEKEPPNRSLIERLELGSQVQWTPGGVDQFERPKRVRAVSDDGEWVFVEGSETGIPRSEVRLHSLAEDQTAKPIPPILPMAAEKKAILEKNKINYKSEDDGTISISARLDAEGLAKMETMLPAFKALLS